MQELGFNYRITDIGCTLALSQLKKLNSFTKKRYKIATVYDKAFKNFDFIKPLYPLNGGSSYHLYVVLVEFDRLNTTKKKLFEQMKKLGIGLQLHYIPVNKQPYYRKLGFGDEKHPVMQNYYKKAFSLPIYPSLTKKDQDYVIDRLIEILDVWKINKLQCLWKLFLKNIKLGLKVEVKRILDLQKQINLCVEKVNGYSF